VNLEESSAGRLLTVGEAAERLNVSAAYVRRRLLFEKRIAYVKIGGHVRIEPAQIEGLIQRGRVEAVALQTQPMNTPSLALIRAERVAAWRTSASTP